MTRSELTPDQARQELYEIMQADTPFETKAERAIELGEAYLDVDNGHLTQIDPDADYWEAIASTDAPDGEFPSGLVLDLNTTYCRRVIDERDSIALHNAPEQGWADDPAFETHELHCYHGTPITIDGEPYGTVCFVSTDPQETPFDDDDTLFAELIARMLEHELDHTQQEAELARRADLISVLSRVLRHNLRNDMTVVRGRLSMIEDRFDAAADLSEPAVNTIDDLIDLSNTARTLESIISTDYDRQQFDLIALLNRVIDTVAEQYPDASITLQAPDRIPVSLKPSFQTALEELIQNAAKHTPDPTVTVTVDATSEAIDIHIQDTGPGLPEQDQAVLRGETDQPLAHGSGLGLWMSYWIVDDHDGTTEATVTDDGTRITVTLPRATTGPDVTDQEVLKQELQREQDRFKAIFEEISEAMAIVDDAGQIIEVNKRAATLFGRSEEAVLGRSVEEFTPDRVDWDARWTEFMKGTQTGKLVPLTRPEGTERTIEFNLTKNIVPDQHVVRLRDVTERQDRERALRRWTEQLALTGGWEYDLMTESLFWTDGTRRIHEVPEDYEPTLEEAIEFYHPADRAEVTTAVEQAIEAGESYQLEVRLQTAKGNERWVEIAGEAIETDETVTAVRGAIRDITDRKTRETRLTALQNAFPDLAFIIDEEGRHVELLASPASEELLYTSPEELIGEQIQDVLPDDTAEDIYELVQRTLETGEPQRLEYELDVQAGLQRFEARTSVLPRRIDGRRAVTWVARAASQ